MKYNISRPYPPCIVGSVADADTLRHVVYTDQTPDCDMIELRVDGLLRSGMSFHEIEQVQATLPLLVTVRTPEEGGLYPFANVQERAELAMRLLPRAAALDWEIAHMEAVPQLVAAAKKAGVPIIASAHDFGQTPALEQLGALEYRARELGADVVKFAFFLNQAEDMQVGVNLLRQASGPMAVMGMGKLGPVSRLLYAQHGSCLVYGYFGAAPTAPGQWSTTLFRAALASLQHQEA
ncbi:MAG: type I 3-dehydroquinate dehydratase [Akkermansia sp.]|nr:type I 3-dehydroquinate dehydratase [Akkermansia sp.]